jgi:hypothetical protein
MSNHDDSFFRTFAADSKLQSKLKSINKMFERLKNKWKVDGLQLFLVLCTFAIGGSLTGFLGKKIMNVLSIEQDWLWGIVYILLVTIIWPFSVMMVSIFFGQFRFFQGYLRKMGQRMGFIKKPAESRNGDLVELDKPVK